MVQVGRNWIVWWKTDTLGPTDYVLILLAINSVRAAYATPDTTDPLAARKDTPLIVDACERWRMDWPGGE